MAIEKKSKTTPSPSPSPSPRPGSRNVKSSRYAAGVNVAISIAAATALLIVANIISGKNVYRRDMQTLGRYGLSEAASRILDQMDKPIRLTSIYTSTDEARKPQQYLPRLRDLLDEIARRKDNISVVNVTSDRQKAEVLARLRQALDETAAGHQKVIRDFQILSDTQRPRYEQLARRWRMYPSTGWLGQFGEPKAIENVMIESRNELRKTAVALREELAAAALPDYPGMVGKVEDTLGALQENLERLCEQMRELSSLPEKARKASPELLAKADAVTAAIAKASEQVGKAGSPAPADPSKVLEGFALAASTAADEASLVARLLDNFAGDGMVRYARSWRASATPLPDRYRRLAAVAASLSQQAEGVRVAAKIEIQSKAVDGIRRVMPDVLANARQSRSAVGKILKELVRIDEATENVFKQAGRDQYLQAQLKPIEKLLGIAGKVGRLGDQKELIEQIGRDNIVIVEVGGKTGVVGFDDVWPLAAGRRTGLDERERDRQRRVFYGDMAICAKMLSLSAEPFADVVVTFFEDIPPRFLRQQQPPLVGPIVSLQLRTVRERLEKANLTVKDWNMAKDGNPPAPSPGRGQVLLVLPPPEPLPMPRGPGGQRPRWGAEYVRKIRKTIDGGTPAIFLAGYFRPQYMGQFGVPSFYGFSDYLLNDWGIDVKTALRVIQGRADPLNPGRFELPITRWTFLPLSHFTDNAIGSPLKARRLHWLDVCPISPVRDGKSGAVVEDILTVPGWVGDTWAAAKPERLMMKMYTGQGGGVVPDTDAGDILPPFAVAVQASKDVPVKSGQGAVRTARVVVLGTGVSYIDGFLNSPVPRVTANETIASDPPSTADVDLLINSVYHLIGKDQYIGAGPAVIEPISQIDPGTMAAIKIAFGLVWPVLIFAAGIVVMMVRRRG